jgi:hypothetical protein
VFQYGAAVCFGLTGSGGAISGLRLFPTVAGQKTTQKTVTARAADCSKENPAHKMPRGNILDERRPGQSRLRQ